MSAEEKPSAGAFCGLATALLIAEAGPGDGDGISEFRITRDGTGTVRYYVGHDLDVPAEVYRDALATFRAQSVDMVADELADIAAALRGGRS